MPLSGADSCRVRLIKTGDFEFACVAPGNWVGKGKFTYDGHRIHFEYDWITRPDGTRRSRPSPVSMRIEGSEMGNALELSTSDGRAFEWKREAP